MKYAKPALGLDRQIDQLESRGMVFGNRALAGLINSVCGMVPMRI